MYAQIRLIAALFFFSVYIAGAQQPAFVHPGELNNARELNLIQSDLAKGAPVRTGAYTLLLNNDDKWLQYKPHAYRTVSAQRGRKDLDSSRDHMVADGEAVYANTLLWYMSRQEAHAEKAIEIIRSWSDHFSNIVGDDSILALSYAWPQYIWAAEILRSSYSQWQKQDQVAFETLLRSKILPAGTTYRYRYSFPSNWTSWAICLKMTAAVYLDNRPMFEESCKDFTWQIGYYINNRGYCEELCRDLWHAQMGLAPLVIAAEIAWKQGRDLYSTADNKLLTAFETLVPVMKGDLSHWPCEAEPKDIEKGYWPVYEILYNHYHHREKVHCKDISEFLKNRRPEGYNRLGYGTLTHYKEE